MVIAADHVRDFHQRIINHDYIVINRHSRRAQNNGIADDFIRKLNRAMNDVMKTNRMVGNAQADGASFSGSPAALRLGRINGAAFS